MYMQTCVTNARQAMRLVVYELKKKKKKKENKHFSISLDPARSQQIDWSYFYMY